MRRGSNSAAIGAVVVERFEPQDTIVPTLSQTNGFDLNHGPPGAGRYDEPAVLKKSFAAVRESGSLARQTDAIRRCGVP